MVAGVGRYVRSDHLTVGALFAVGVPLPPMTEVELAELARTWLEEARAMRQRIDFAPPHLLHAAESARHAPDLGPRGRRVWAQLAGYRAPG